MKRLLTTLFVFLSAIHITMGQAPGKINYQAVAHNLASGDVYANQQLSIRFSIIPGSPGNVPTYQEEHVNISTNEYGLFNIQIGGGSVISGSFAAIVWSGSNHYLRVEVDDGSGYQVLGTTQFLSVPYAFYAQNAGSSGLTAGPGISITGGVISNTGDSDNDPLNEIQDISYNAITRDLSLSSGSTINLATLIDDADASPTNEIQSLNYNTSSHILGISSGNTVDLTGLLNDGDASPTNEIQTLTYNAGTHVLGLSSSGTVDLTGLINDADASITNETVSNFGISGSNLQLVEAGSVFQVPLSQLADTDWQVGAGTVFNTSDNIGIGVVSPMDKLHINAGTIRIQNGASFYRLPPVDGNSNEVIVTDGAGNANWGHALTPLKISNVSNAHSITQFSTTYMNTPIITFTPEATGIVQITYTCRYNRSMDYPHQCTIGFHVKNTSGVPPANTTYTAFSYAGQAQAGSGGFGDEQITVVHAMSVVSGTTYYVYAGTYGSNFSASSGGQISSHKTIATLHKLVGL